MAGMTTEAEFIAAVIANPLDDALRLIYADWLEEFGGEAGQMRAEFIRVQIKLAKWQAAPERPTDAMVLLGRQVALHQEMAVLRVLQEPHDPCDCEICLEKRGKDLLEASIHGGESRNRVQWGKSVGLLIGRPLGRVPDEWFRRGFVERIACTANDWIAHADAITAAAPICEVELTSWPVEDALCDPLQWGLWMGKTWPELFSEKWPGIVFRWPEVVDRVTLRQAGSILGGLPLRQSENIPRGQVVRIAGNVFCHPDDYQALVQSLTPPHPDTPAQSAPPGP